MNIVTVRANGSKRVRYVCTDKSRTQQHHAAECDIESIVASYKRNGIDIDKIKGYMAPLESMTFADASEVPSFQDAMNIVVAGQLAFDALPATVRARFSNDPSQFLDFVGNPANLREAEFLGLSELVSDKPSSQPEVTAENASGATTGPV